MVDNGNKRNPFIYWLRTTAQAYRQNNFNRKFEKTVAGPLRDEMNKKHDPNAISERYKEFLHNDDWYLLSLKMEVVLYNFFFKF